MVLASDAAHFYEELELERPFAVMHDLEQMYAGYDLLKRLRAGGRHRRPGARPGRRAALHAGRGRGSRLGGPHRMIGLSMSEAPAAASGMIGLGNMGGRIARRIRDAGLPVQGYDRSAAQARARPASQPPASIAELAAAADVVFLSLPDCTVVEAVVVRRRRPRSRAPAPGRSSSTSSTAAPELDA